MKKGMNAIGGFFGDQPLALVFEATGRDKFELTISERTNLIVLDKSDVIEMVQMMLDVLREEL